MFVVHFIGHAQKICKPGFEKNLRKIRSLIFHETPQEVKYFPQPFCNRHFAYTKFLADLFQCIEPKVVKPKQFLVIIRQSWKDLPEFVLPQKKECLLKGWIGWLVCEQTGHCVNFIPNEIQVTLVTSSLSTFP